MKELNPAHWIYWFGLLTIACMLLPVVVILVKRQFSPGFIALTIYFVSTFIYNFLMILVPDFPKDIRRYIGVTNNFLDAPLMLFFLSHFTQVLQTKRLIRICLIAYLFFELCIVLFYGFSIKAISIFSGPGLLVVLCFSFFFFTRHIKMAITQKMDLAKALMISGILFAYAVYFMVYLFYYVLETPNKVDALIIYFLGSIVASILLSSGLIKEKKMVMKEVVEGRTKYKMQQGQRLTI